MSAKMTCPGCGARLSSVLLAFEEGNPCPACGLSHDAAAEIVEIQGARADEALKRRLAEVLAQKGTLETEVTQLRAFAATIRAELDELEQGLP